MKSDSELGKFESTNSQSWDVSELDVGTDPFARRPGKTLQWRNVNMNITGSRGAPDRKILDNVWGEVPPYQTTAILGASGAGKTSMLNVIAGRSTSRGRITVEADVRLDNYIVDPTDINVRKRIAFVGQDDSLSPTATPREAIRFSAKLRLPRSTSEAQLDKLTHRMLTELGLLPCSETIVGGGLIKGLSGGEKKRTMVGVELVTKPSLLFLDEPTSGLDSFSAVQICQVLKKVATAGASVLFTIHQPSSEIFASLDYMLLMNRGRILYQGPTVEVSDYFAERGFPVPGMYNPSDWVMAVAQTKTEQELDNHGFYQPLAKAAHNPIGRYKSRVSENLQKNELPHGIWTQTKMLYRRELTALRRDKVGVSIRMSLSLFFAILEGVIFLNVGRSSTKYPENVQSQFGAAVIVLLGSMVASAQYSLLTFPQERPVFLREYSTDHYSVASYFLSRFTLEISLSTIEILIQVIIPYYMIGFQTGLGNFYGATLAMAQASNALALVMGAAMEKPNAVQEMLPILFVPQILFAGVFVSPNLIPSWLRWGQYLCSLTYATRIIAVAQFGSCTDIFCSALLRNLGASSTDVWAYWVAIVLMFVVLRVFALAVLQMKALKFY